MRTFLSSLSIGLQEMAVQELAIQELEQESTYASAVIAAEKADRYYQLKKNLVISQIDDRINPSNLILPRPRANPENFNPEN